MHKKNIILVFLLFLIAVPMLFCVYTIIEKNIIEFSMEKKLARGRIHTITLNASSVIWLEKNKEILVNGEPFDIKTITRSGNKITFSGLFDLREKVLKNQLEAYQNSKDRSASESNSFLLLLFANYYQVAEPINLNVPVLVNKEKEWQKYQDKIHSLYPEILIPPPRYV